jgi:hypothetical protein
MTSISATVPRFFIVCNLTAGRVKIKLYKMNYKVIADSVKNRKLIRKKVMISAFAVGLCMTANLMAQVPSYVPTNGLVGWWPFNGNANDESGNGNNGTVNGATLSTDRFGVANKAYSFDGNSNFISIQNSNSLSPQNITLSSWFFVSQNYLAGNLNILSKMNHSNATNYSFGIGLDSLTIKKYIGYSTVGCNTITGSGGDGVKTNEITQIGTWNMFLVTITNNGNVSIFINGILVNQYQGNPFIPCNNLQSELRFGHWWNTDNQWFYGNLDDIGIWNRTLNECEIQDLYNAQLGSFSNANISVNPTSSSIGSNATLSVSSPVSSLQWQSNPGNMGWNNVVDNGIYTGATNDTLVVSNLQLSNHNQPFRVLACGDTSNFATIQIADTCITTIYDTLYATVTDTLIINTTLSLPAPNNENTILIYPNPASDHITIDNGNFSAMAGYSIKIENNAGQQVFQSLINQAQFYVDLSTWTGNGLYFVHLIDPQNNTVTVRKIVLQ